MANMVNRSRSWLMLAGLSAVGSACYTARGISSDALSSLPSALLKQVTPWRLLAILFALFNLKSLPFAWHVRLFRGLFSHVSLRRSYCPPSPGPAALFQPVITSTHTSLLEMDYNFHKSNSTYFSDLDVSRMNHIASLLKHGLHRAHFGTAQRPDGSRRGRLGVMLGGVTCTFKREIKPYAGYEVWTRVLAWDRKWLYLVSHIVKKGAAVPRGYTLQPHLRAERRRGPEAGRSDVDGAAVADAADAAVGEKTDAPHPAIYASSIAKYVFKEGRITVPPEQVLELSGLLPPRPEAGDAVAPGASVPGVSATGSMEGAVNGARDWDGVERERVRGMVAAQNMANLDDLHWEFTGDKTPAIGRF